MFYIHTDHLNAPTKITRPSDNAVIWRWDHDPYGNGVPNEDPDGNGLLLKFNLRFPGQYYDAETGLLQNGFRYYDQNSGRYISSDPMGLNGGSFSTYAYAGGNPISIMDPLGLLIWNNNSTLWLRDYQYNSNYTAWPNRRTHTDNPYAAAMTTANWSLASACECNKDGKWSLKEYTVDFNAVVHLLSSYSGFESGFEAWAMRGEGDHVADFLRWTKSAKVKAKTLEDSEKGTKYTSKNDCEFATRDQLSFLMQREFPIAWEQTKIDWDKSGKHDYGGPHQRP